MHGGQRGLFAARHGAHLRPLHLQRRGKQHQRGLLARESLPRRIPRPWGGGRRGGAALGRFGTLAGRGWALMRRAARAVFFGGEARAREFFPTRTRAQD